VSRLVSIPQLFRHCVLVALSLACTGVVLAQGASEADDVSQMLRAARSFLRQPQQHEAGQNLLFRALNAFNPEKTTDRQAFQSLADDLRGSLRNHAELSQYPLQRFAALKMPPDDPLVDLYARILARDYASHANMQVGMLDNVQLTQFVIEIADGARSGGAHAFAVLLYRVAMRWGAETGRVYDAHVSDRTPIRQKLEASLRALGERPVAPTPSIGRMQDDGTCGSGSRDIEREMASADACVVQGRSHWLAEKHDAAIEAFSRFADAYERILGMSLMGQSEQLGEYGYRLMEANVGVALKYLSMRAEPRAREAALQLLVSRGGRIMEMQGDRARVHRSSGDRGAQVMRWRAMRATLLLRGKSPEYQALIPQARIPGSLSQMPGMPPLMEAVGQLQFAEEQMSWAMTRDASAFVTRPVTNEQLRSAHDSQTVSLVYALIKDIDPRTGVQGPANYVLWPVSAQEIGRPRLLAPEASLDPLVSSFLRALVAVQDKPRSATDSNTVRTDARKLHSLLLPDDIDLKPFKRLIIVGDGILLKLPFSALTSSDGQSLVATHDVIVSNGLRHAVRPGTAAAATEPVLFGNSLKLPGPSAASIAHWDFLTTAFTALQGAESEVRQIAEILGPRTRLYVSPKTNKASDAAIAEASEAAVKAVRSPAVLHIATHGDYIQDSREGWLNFSVSANHPSGKRAPAVGVANPWLRAYLAMDEYNKVQPLASEDGILTDAEIVGLNLDGTILAVASACFSGVGPVQAGAGVFSLRNAFAMAGAKTQVVSLWAVGDEGTTEFMKVFYGHIRDGSRTLDAFIQTQRQLRLDPKYGDPYFWAAFTISGSNESVPSFRRAN
jgi:CHAT domain-containing protein